MTGRCIAALFLASSLVACGGDPQPQPDPGPRRQRPRPTPTPAATPTPAEGPTDITIKRKTFPKEFMEFRVGDQVEVDLARHGRADGVIQSLEPDLLRLTREGSAVLTLRPDEVQGMELLHRPTNSLDFDPESARNEEETWLDEYADRQVLGKNPRKLWQERFQDSPLLVVVQPVELRMYVFLKRTTRNYFRVRERSFQVEPRDQIRYVGTSVAHAEQVSGEDRELGEIQLYLVRRGASVWLVCSPDPLPTAALSGESLDRFQDYVWVTLVGYHLRPPAPKKRLKILRLRGKTARVYYQRLEETPDRPTIRRLRASDPAALQRAEKLVRSFYKAVGLEDEDDFDLPVLIQMRAPRVVGGSLRLVPIEKEIGLD